MFHQVLSFPFPFLDLLFHVTWWAVLLLFLQKILDIYIVFHTLTHHSWFTTPQFLCFITMMQSAVFCLPADRFQSSNMSLWFCRQDWTPQKNNGLWNVCLSNQVMSCYCTHMVYVWMKLSLYQPPCLLLCSAWEKGIQGELQQGVSDWKMQKI